MASDIFMKKNVVDLLSGKCVIFLGGSNMRGIYKDFVCLLNSDKLITQEQLKSKLEPSFMGDDLIQGGKLTNSVSYEEIREFKMAPDINFQFTFLTRCYNKYILELMSDVKNGRTRVPDVIVMNSCLWDVSRYGQEAVQSYRDNMLKLMELFKECLPEKTLVIWTTTLPVSTECYGGVVVEEGEAFKQSLRYEMMEGNIFTQNIIEKYGYNVIDFHYHLQHLVQMRTKDGIHWFAKAVRYMTNILLTNIALLLNVPLPGNFKSDALTSTSQDIILRKRRLSTMLTSFTEMSESCCFDTSDLLEESNASAIETDDRKEIPATPKNSNISDCLYILDIRTPRRHEAPSNWGVDRFFPQVTVMDSFNDMVTENSLCFIIEGYFHDIHTFMGYMLYSVKSYNPSRWLYMYRAPYCAEQLNFIMSCSRHYIRHLRSIPSSLTSLLKVYSRNWGDDMYFPLPCISEENPCPSLQRQYKESIRRPSRPLKDIQNYSEFYVHHNSSRYFNRHNPY